MLNLKLTEHKESLEKRLAALHYLATHKVDVGLPPGSPPRSRFLLAIHERGSPVMHIPPRPVIGPGLSRPETRQAMTEALTAAVTAAHEGDEAAAQAGLEACGQAGADGIRAYIDSGIKPGNSPVTISGGWIYNRVARKGVLVGGKGFDKPLYETGELYNSFSYEVKSR